MLIDNSFLIYHKTLLIKNELFGDFSDKNEVIVKR